MDKGENPSIKIIFPILCFYTVISLQFKKHTYNTFFSFLEVKHRNKNRHKLLWLTSLHLKPLSKAKNLFSFFFFKQVKQTHRFTQSLHIANIKISEWNWLQKKIEAVVIIKKRGFFFLVFTKQRNKTIWKKGSSDLWKNTKTVFSPTKADTIPQILIWSQYVTDHHHMSTHPKTNYSTVHSNKKRQTLTRDHSYHLSQPPNSTYWNIVLIIFLPTNRLETKRRVFIPHIKEANASSPPTKIWDTFEKQSV